MVAHSGCPGENPDCLKDDEAILIIPVGTQPTRLRTSKAYPDTLSSLLLEFRANTRHSIFLSALKSKNRVPGQSQAP